MPRTNSTEKSKPQHRTTFRLDADVRVGLELIAKEECLSVNGQLNRLLRQAIRSHNLAQAKARRKDAIGALKN